MIDKQIEVFTVTPWEIEAVSALLRSAHIDIKIKDQKKMTIFVPSDQYVTATKIIDNRS